ncbi:kunitz-type serine protease inhibitor homolog beta-bungarotoxin BF B2 chain [Drosophila eugracilis]|uniref:kunitz-type serine protease inhibitor homolog beta-bungarotoxin BF B2 chain n=1 Tax=Drosophila eugracilis TaxID=29029 RepID=UPI0007E84DC5|nr:kunitz-type serine protease inhibitor homolog beta-bungarotoxin BF B2 chain [Drosophila eugracilis]
MRLFSILCLIFFLFSCVLSLKHPSCGVKYRGVGLCKMLITKIVYIPSENVCKTVHISGCSAEGTFFKSIKACEAKCKE